MPRTPTPPVTHITSAMCLGEGNCGDASGSGEQGDAGTPDGCVPIPGALPSSTSPGSISSS